ncbi:cilia- and flagella-associated protein HOATZ [Chanos chanos]|uniref:Cilia- and flagella-associated protein HOATZ n=1 Tax=Chanos chanos TaxID=29144 RepID=A0A6J2WXD9_CHACN|nr:UPF0722 protein C11orf88 homolog [Chanos chanos]
MTENPDEKFFDELAELEKLYTVFGGSAQEDVACAKVFWNSLSLQPPLESRLVSADIKQRLRIAKPPQSSNTAQKNTESCQRNDEFLQDLHLKQKQEERQRYTEMAKKRDQIIELLRKQRDERIKKEMLSLPHKTRKSGPERRPVPKTPPQADSQDIKDVEALQ